MGSSELYNLRWNDFQSCLSSSVADLLEESDFTDVTLACSDGQNFNVHKIVLSACSQYFKKVLKRNPCQHPVIILKDVSANILNSLIDFIYHGAADVPQESINEFLKTAQSLDIKGLAEEGAEKKSQFDSRSGSSNISQRNIARKRFSPYSVPDQPHRASPSQRSSPSDRPRYTTQPKQLPIETARALVSSDRSTPSSTPQDVMDRLQKRDLSIFKTGGSTSRYESDEEVSVVNIKEEKTEDVRAKDEPNAGNSEHFMVDPSQDASQLEYDQGEYDEAYAEGYEGGEGGMYAEYEAGDGNSGSNDHDSPSWTCSQCGRNYRYQASLKRHMDHECGKDPQFWCPACPKRMKDKSSLYRHARSQHGIELTKKFQEMP